MPDYSKGKIYSIRSHLTDDVYIGSTIQRLSDRLAKHKKFYKQWLITKKHCYSSFKIIEKDPENCYIELVELYPCNSKNELERREGEIIRATTCVNKNIAGRTKQEWRKDNKEHLKQYSLQNKEHIDEKRKIYREKYKAKIADQVKTNYENNKEKYKQYSKEYHLNNKVKINEQHRQRYENNKEQLKQKYTCECGSTPTIYHKSRHEKSKKHQTFINSSN